ncbi:TPA: hypothetical protein JI383_RS15365, partial [Acinetobacter baumannii]|nr:hypothetical protein [Acinetobacter baumannii]
MSSELNQENIIKTLENVIKVYSNEKKKLKVYLEELEDYLSESFINHPIQVRDFKALISTNLDAID